MWSDSELGGQADGHVLRRCGLPLFRQAVDVVFRAVADTQQREVHEAVVGAIAHLGGPAGAAHPGDGVRHGQVVVGVLVELTVYRSQAEPAGTCLHAGTQEGVTVQRELREGEVAVAHVEREPLIRGADAELVERLAESRLVVVVPGEGEGHADAVDGDGRHGVDAEGKGRLPPGYIARNSVEGAAQSKAAVHGEGLHLVQVSQVLRRQRLQEQRHQERQECCKAFSVFHRLSNK